MVEGQEQDLWLWQEVICVAVCSGLRGHKFAVNVLDSVSPELVVSGSFDSMVKLWTPKGTHVATLTGHSASITALKVCTVRLVVPSFWHKLRTNVQNYNELFVAVS